MRASTGAAIGIIPELMNVHSSLSRRVVSLDIVGDNGRGLFRSLFETHRSAHGGVPAENCYYKELSAPSREWRVGEVFIGG